MKKEIFQEIEIPSGVDVSVHGNTITVKGEGKESKKRLNISKIDLKVDGNKVLIGSKTASKKEKRLINTYAAHIRNMINGVSEGFEYKLKIAFSHFPMTVEVNGNEAVIKNFLGEKIPRKLKILKGTNVQINKDVITIHSHDKELAGQTAANFEIATKVGKRDRRVFQDGVFITKKPGREI